MKKKFIILNFIAIGLFFQLQAQENTIRINKMGYLSCKGFSMFVYHNNYFVGKQGAIELIKHDKRLITNGMVVYKLENTSGNHGKPEVFYEPIPKTQKPERIVDKKQNTITVPFHYKALNLKYDLKLQPNGMTVIIKVVFKKIPDNLKEISFDMELFPGFFRGKSFAFENKTGLFPLHFQSAVKKTKDDIIPEPLGRGKELYLAPEDKNLNLFVSVKNGEMLLLDTRSHTNHNLFTVKAIIDLEEAEKNGFEMKIDPKISPDYMKKPVIGYSQIGYHPEQKKEIVIEVDTNYVNDKKLSLFKLNKKTGEFDKIKSAIPTLWGRYNRYNYLIFDITQQKEEGLYYIAFNNLNRTNAFAINKEVYANGAWQPALETFIPVQMCHMHIRDRNRIWHGVCHLDDALQAPVSLRFFDGFHQGDTTDTPFEPLQTIPGLNRGGWHDAGDDDVNTASSGKTTYHLALIKEEFGINTDQTTIDFEKREVFLHRPDGKSDIIQQIKHGLHFILPQYKACGHGIVGVISNSFDTYLIPGTWGHMTDQLLYDSLLNKNQRTATHSGIFDDRFAFTNKDSRAEFRNSYILAASYRALKHKDKKLADSCLQLAEKIWTTEMEAKPVFYSCVGVPNDLQEQQIIAATELYLSTSKNKYLNFIVNSEDYILSHTNVIAWCVSRVKDKITDKQFMKKFNKKLVEYNKSHTSMLSQNPYGVDLSAELWGYGWDILWKMYKHYFLIKNYPEIFSINPLIDCNEFMLGKHMYSNIPYISGVGSDVPLPAFTMNRSDYSYIPGGVFSGVNLIEPDFPELMENHPFIWQQSEIIIFGATPYIFTILAVDKLLR